MLRRVRVRRSHVPKLECLAIRRSRNDRLAGLFGLLPSPGIGERARLAAELFGHPVLQMSLGRR